VSKAELTANGVKLTTAPAKGAGSEEVMEADVVLVATGRRPYLEGLGIEVRGGSSTWILVDPCEIGIRAVDVA